MTGQRASKPLSETQLESAIADAMERESSDLDGETESESLDSDDD